MRLLGPVALAAAMITSTVMVDSTGAAFSGATANSGNSFSAAGSFCTNIGTQTVVPDADSYIDENAAGSNFGTATDLHVQSRRGGGRNRRALVHFPLPAAQFCAVTSATLRLNATSAAPGRTLVVYQLAAGWTETGVTWSYQPAAAGSASSAPSAMGWVQWDVTAHVQAMYAGSNHGFLVRDRTESQNPASLQVFVSREGPVNQPELLITLA
jgi:hypothetical protein